MSSDGLVLRRAAPSRTPVGAVVVGLRSVWLTVEPRQRFPEDERPGARQFRREIPSSIWLLHSATSFMWRKRGLCALKVARELGLCFGRHAEVFKCVGPPPSEHEIEKE